jgi:TolB-like protein
MNRKFLIALLVSVLIISNFAFAAEELDSKFDELTNQIVTNITLNSKSRIAVIEFSDIDGKVTALGKFVAEELTTRLFITKKFEVIERELLNKVIQEHKLSLTGIIDQATAKELGKIIGVDAIVTGTITDFGKTAKINARLIATETGAIFAAAAVEIAKDENIEKLMAKVVVEPKQESPVVTPVKPDIVKDEPLPTPSGSQTELSPEVETFTNQVLTAIAGKQPIFRDEFDSSQSGWEKGLKKDSQTEGQSGYDYITKEYYITAAPLKVNYATSSAIPELADFVIEIAGRFTSEANGNWQLKFRKNSSGAYSIAISKDDLVSISSIDKKRNQLELFKVKTSFLKKTPYFNQVKLIVKGPRIILLINEKLIACVTDPNYEKLRVKRGQIQLAVANQGDALLRVQFDDLKIWDISKMEFYNTPSPNLEGLPIEAGTFASQVLNSISGRKPYFEDDFSSNSGVWLVGVKINKDQDGELGYDYLKKEYFIATFPKRNVGYTAKFELADFVMEFDVRIEANCQNAEWSVNYRAIVNDNVDDSYTIKGKQNGEFTILNYGNRPVKYPTRYFSKLKLTNINTNEMQHVLFMAKGPKMVLFINNQYAGFAIESNPEKQKRGRIKLTAVGGDQPTKVCWDNLKIWDLSSK